MKRPRKVFGRLRVDLNGNGKVTFELRRDGLHLRPLHSRQPKLITFPELLDAAEGQMRMKI